VMGSRRVVRCAPGALGVAACSTQHIFTPLDTLYRVVLAGKSDETVLEAPARSTSTCVHAPRDLVRLV